MYGSSYVYQLGCSVGRMKIMPVVRHTSKCHLGFNNNQGRIHKKIIFMFVCFRMKTFFSSELWFRGPNLRKTYSQNIGALEQALAIGNYLDTWSGFETAKTVRGRVGDSTTLVISLRSVGISPVFREALYSSWRGWARLLLHCLRSIAGNSSGSTEVL